MPEIDEQIAEQQLVCRHWWRIYREHPHAYSVPLHFAAGLKLKRLRAKKAELSNVQ